MRHTQPLLAILVVAVASMVPPRAPAYVGKPPPTLGELCRQSDYIFVLKVRKFSAEKGVIVFKASQKLKAKTELADGVLAKQTIDAKVKGAKIILDWAGEGKTAVFFGTIGGPGGGRRSRFSGAGYVYIDKYWYLAGYDPNSESWSLISGEPAMLAHYCGTPEKLAEAVPKILAGEEVVVSAMVGGSKEDLESRTGKIRDLRASLKPDLVGKIKSLSKDGKTLTLLPDAKSTDKKPAALDIQIAEGTRVIALGKSDTAKLAVGQDVRVWLEIGDDKVAATVQIGRPR